jgi:hypothetical protein
MESRCISLRYRLLCVCVRVGSSCHCRHKQLHLLHLHAIQQQYNHNRFVITAMCRNHHHTAPPPLLRTHCCRSRNAPGIAGLERM